MEFENPVYEDEPGDDFGDNQIQAQAVVHAEMDPVDRTLENRLRNLRGEDTDETYRQVHEYADNAYFRRYNEATREEQKRLDEVEKLRRFYKPSGRMNPNNRIKLKEKISREEDGALYFQDGDEKLRLTKLENSNDYLANSTIKNQIVGRKFLKYFSEDPFPPNSNVISVEAEDIDRHRPTLNDIEEMEPEQVDTVFATAAKWWRNKLNNLLSRIRRLKDKINKLKNDQNEETIPLLNHEEKNLAEATQQTTSFIENSPKQMSNAARRRAENLSQTVNDRTKPLGDRLRSLFRLKGVKIASIVTAVIIVISSIGATLGNLVGGSAAVKPSPKPGPSPRPGPSPQPKPSNPVVDGLKKFANWLKSLAGKAAAAIPGIVGSILAKILTAASEVVGYMARHTVILIAVTILAVVKILMLNWNDINKQANKIANK